MINRKSMRWSTGRGNITEIMLKMALKTIPSNNPTTCVDYRSNVIHSSLSLTFRKILRIRLKPFQNKPWFLHVCTKSFFKTLWEKEKLLITSNFSFSHSVFYLFGELSAFFIKFKIVVCKVFQLGSV